MRHMYLLFICFFSCGLRGQRYELRKIIGRRELRIAYMWYLLRTCDELWGDTPLTRSVRRIERLQKHDWNRPLGRCRDSGFTLINCAFHLEANIRNQFVWPLMIISWCCGRWKHVMLTTQVLSVIKASKESISVLWRHSCSDISLIITYSHLDKDHNNIGSTPYALGWYLCLFKLPSSGVRKCFHLRTMKPNQLARLAVSLQHICCRVYCTVQFAVLV